MDVDTDKVRDRLREAFILLYNTDLNTANQVTIEGLLGITLNNEHIVLVNINENLSADVTETRFSTGKPIARTAVKRPLSHKNVKTKAFKRHKSSTFNPQHENQCGKETADESHTPNTQTSNTPQESQQNYNRSDLAKRQEIVSLSDHLSGTDMPANVKNEPVIADMAAESVEDEDDSSGEENTTNEGDNCSNAPVPSGSPGMTSQQNKHASGTGNDDNDVQADSNSRVKDEESSTGKTELEKMVQNRSESPQKTESSSSSSFVNDTQTPAKTNHLQQSNINTITNTHQSQNTTATTCGGDDIPENSTLSNSSNNVSMVPDMVNCRVVGGALTNETMATDVNSTDNLVSDTAQLFAATYQVLEGADDNMLPPNQHGMYAQSSSTTSVTQMAHPHLHNAATSSPNQAMPQNMPTTCSSSTGHVPPTGRYIGNKPDQHQNPMHNMHEKPLEPPKLAHPNPPNPVSNRPTAPPSYPGMWSNQARPPIHPHNRPPAMSNVPSYGSPMPPRSFPSHYPVRNESTQAKSFENQFSDFIRARHGSPYPQRPANMQDGSRPPLPPNQTQNYQANVQMNKYTNVNRYPFHQQLGPAAGAIRDLAIRQPSPQYPRGPQMVHGNAGPQSLQHHQVSGQQQPQQYGQGPSPGQQPYMGGAPGQWNQPMNQHQMMSPRHSSQTPPHSQHQNYPTGHPQQQQLMQTAVRNDGSPVPQIASPSLSQQAISNIPPIDPPLLHSSSTPEKPSTPKKKKSSPKISRETNQESVKMQEEKALLENPHANVHIGHPKGKKCKFHRSKNSKDKYTVFGCRACNVALCKECHDEYHNELGESHQKLK